jgi:hypothetical protein
LGFGFQGFSLHPKPYNPGLALLAGSGDGAAPEGAQKGLFALPFMARALERQRQSAKAEAEQLLKDLQEEEHVGAACLTEFSCLVGLLFCVCVTAGMWKCL